MLRTNHSYVSAGPTSTTLLESRSIPRHSRCYVLISKRKLTPRYLSMRRLSVGATDLCCIEGVPATGVDCSAVLRAIVDAGAPRRATMDPTALVGMLGSAFLGLLWQAVLTSAVRAAWPTTRPAHSFLKFRTHTLDVLSSSFRFLDRDNPANPLIARQWRNILPFCPRHLVGNENPS